MNNVQQRAAAKHFAEYWKDKGYEKGESQKFWLSLLSDVFGVEHAAEFIEFEDQVHLDNTSFIDGFIPTTKVLIEQKSLGKSLTAPIPQSDGTLLNPLQQAQRYVFALLKEKGRQAVPRWVVTCNFEEFRVYDLDHPQNEAQVIKLVNLPDEYYRLKFLVDTGDKNLKKEMELSLKAGELVGKIHDRFLEQYNDPMAKHTQRSLNILCVRLVFCLYAEDAGLFGAKDAFSSYLMQYEPKDIRRALIDLFKVLDTPLEERADLYLADDLAGFPYVNGGLFQDENIVIPKITDALKTILIESAKFDWSKISPTIFGAVFESTLNPETRRSGGMHYTSIENIHKVIDPLFLDDLRTELAEIKGIAVQSEKTKKLKQYQHKLASLTFLDPACGSGNFLTETYICLRRLENEVLLELHKGQVMFANEETSPIQVSISQFYGIEINDFAVTVAKTALWIAESQMMKETEDVVLMPLDFLPLKTNASIVEGNALLIDWNKIIHKEQLSFIMGNPPFVGARLMTPEQKSDLQYVFKDNKSYGNLDYVSGWYEKSAELMLGTNIRAALVSTNSITQGEQVPLLWNRLNQRGVIINYAYRTFRWDSEAVAKAHVHCVIIGFSYIKLKQCTLYVSGSRYIVDNINAYLVSGPNILIDSRKTPISSTNSIVFGSMPNDGGHLSSYSDDDMAKIVQEYPIAEKMFKPFLGATEFLHSKTRWCLWLKGISPSDIQKVPPVLAAIAAVRKMREESARESTRKLASVPYLFGEIRQPDNEYIVIPRHSSENRKYIPMGFVSSEIICGDSNLLLPDASLYQFGVLMSNVHNAWMRTVCGRIKSDYRYSANVVFNNFPWPEPTDEQKAKIEQTAKAILDARALYPDSNLADLYDELTMPAELRTAHQQNDKAVWEAYGKRWSIGSESECVAELMRMYQKLVSST